MRAVPAAVLLRGKEKRSGQQRARENYTSTSSPWEKILEREALHFLQGKKVPTKRSPKRESHVHQIWGAKTFMVEGKKRG